jgi:hypothetical protein
MSAFGGPPVAISLDGPDFTCTGESSPDYDYGEIENEVMPNGDGETARLIQKRVPWFINNCEIEIDMDNNDMERIHAVKKKGFIDITLTLAGGEVIGGRGAIVGTVSHDVANAKATLNIAGAGKLKKQ